MAKLRLKVQMSGKKYWQSAAYTEKHGWGRGLQLVGRGKHYPFLRALLGVQPGVCFCRLLFLFVNEELSGEYVISSVQSCCNKDLKQRIRATAWLQLRVLFGTQKILRCEDGPTPKEKTQSMLSPSSYTFCPPWSPGCTMQIRANIRKWEYFFRLRFLLQSTDFSFVPFLRALFPLSIF